MAYQQFVVSDVNPNDNAGGGGCVCDRRKQEDCKAPFVVCYGNDMEDVLSPHVVICAACVNAFAAAVNKGEIHSVGERNTPTHSVAPEPTPPRRESLVTEAPAFKPDPAAEREHFNPQPDVTPAI